MESSREEANKLKPHYNLMGKMKLDGAPKRKSVPRIPDSESNCDVNQRILRKQRRKEG